MKKAVIAIILACLSVTARAQQNTVELDAAMEKCRTHMTTAQGQFVFQPGYEDCGAIEKLWDIKQGGGRAPAEQDKIDVHNALMRALGQ